MTKSNFEKFINDNVLLPYRAYFNDMDDMYLLSIVIDYPITVGTIKDNKTTRQQYNFGSMTW